VGSVRLAFPAAAILMALAFFLSALSEERREPNAMIYLAYVERGGCAGGRALGLGGWAPPGAQNGG
jgi:hypothetical protein